MLAVAAHSFTAYIDSCEIPQGSSLLIIVLFTYNNFILKVIMLCHFFLTKIISTIIFMYFCVLILAFIVILVSIF